MKRLVSKEEFIELTRIQTPLTQKLLGTGNVVANGIIMPTEMTVFLKSIMPDRSILIYINKGYIRRILRKIEKYDNNFFSLLMNEVVLEDEITDKLQ